MAHDYAYGVRHDSEGSGTAIGTAADDVRILPEVSPGLRGRPAVISNRHGTALAGRVPYSSYDFILEVTLSYGTPELPANVYQNRSTVLKRLVHHRETVWLQRTAPHQGTVEIPIRVLRGVRTGNPRHRLMVPCRTLEPFWRDTSVTHSATAIGSGITNGGDAPIGDGVLSFSGTNGVQRATNTTTGEWVELNANTTATAIAVNLGSGSVTQGGSDVDSVMTSGDPWLIDVDPGANSFSLTGGGACTFTGRDKWQ